MPSLAMAGWVLLRLIRQPSSWLWIALTLLLWVPAAALSPIGMTTGSGGIAALFYELAFLALLAGSAFALLPLSEVQWFLARLDGPARLRTRAAGVVAGGALGLALALLLPIASGRMSLFGVGFLAHSSCLALAHVTLLALLLLSLPLAGSTRALALPLLAWILPAALPGAGFPASALRSLLDVSAHFGSYQDLPVPGSSFAPWTALLALCGAVVLLETGPIRRASHAPR